MADGFFSPEKREYYIQWFEEWHSRSFSPAELAWIAEAKAERARLLAGNLDDGPEGLSGGAGVTAPLKPVPPVLAGGKAQAIPDQSVAERGAF